VDGYRKAEALLKRSAMKDYYKILGVPRTATTKEIKKAFRKNAQEFHPDKYKGEMSKEEVQKKMSDINHSWEVLGNDETRAKYDQGEDPNVKYF
jgi:DnaJ family protein C protein 3